MTTDERKIDRTFREKFDKRIGPVTFAMFMRVSRTSMDLSQMAFGKKLGISRANVCDIEKGRQLVSAEFAVKVARKAELSEKMALHACLMDQVRKTGLDVQIKVS